MSYLQPSDQQNLQKLSEAVYSKQQQQQQLEESQQGSDWNNQTL